jgi:DNA-binding response OmpR family regulator
LQIAEAFRTWFSEAGCEVYAVASREQAFPLLSDKHFDLVLLDLMDARLGGLDTLREIHTLKPLAEIVVAASRFDAEVMDRALDVGPLTVLRRPVAKIDVQRLVEAHRHNSVQRRTQQTDRGRGQLAASVRRTPPARSTASEGRERMHPGRGETETNSVARGTGDAYTV